MAEIPDMDMQLAKLFGQTWVEPEGPIAYLNAGVAAGVVQNANDICRDPQLKERELFWVMAHKELGEFTHLGEPAILSSTPARPYRPAPCLGEHTEYICKELLGLSDDEFSELLIDGAFGF